MSDAPRASMTAGPRTPDPVMRIVCRSANHSTLRMKPTTVLAELRREQRWDGSGGHYWVRLAPSTKRERKLWQASEPGDGTPMPRAFRDWNGVEGFHWLRHGQPVSEGEGYSIGQAFHHNARRARRGTPDPGTLDGITRHFVLSSCACGAPGLRPTLAEPIEAALDRLHAAHRDEVTCHELRAMIDATPNTGRGAADPK